MVKLVTVLIFVMALSFVVALGGVVLNWSNYVCDIGLIVFIISMFSSAVASSYNIHTGIKKKGDKK